MQKRGNQFVVKMLEITTEQDGYSEITLLLFGISSLGFILMGYSW